MTNRHNNGILEIYYFFYNYFFFKGGGFILNFKRFADIESVYNIIDIKDEYILSKEGDKLNRIYIYEIDPIPIINISQDIQNNISNTYTTFLREINVDFQVLVINKKISLNNFFNSKNSSINNEKYLYDMRVKIRDDKIFYAKYYLIVALKKQEQIEDIDKIIYILKNCGCDVARIKDKTKIENFLYECINKEDIYGS